MRRGRFLLLIFIILWVVVIIHFSVTMYSEFELNERKGERYSDLVNFKSKSNLMLDNVMPQVRK